MQIEVIRDTGGKQIFTFDNDKVISVGRMSNSDIRLVGEGVSREHVQIYYKNDKVYLLDRESTNGVFINNERVPPGKEVEFTTYFQVKIGKAFFLSLLDHEATEVRKIETPSKAELSERNINSFRQYKEKTRPKRAPVRIETKKTKEAKNSSLSIYAVLGVLVLGGAVWFQMNREPSQNTEMQADAPVVVKRKGVDETVKSFLTQEDKTKLDPLIKGTKCQSETEKQFCATFSRELSPGEGVLVSENSVFIFVNFAQNIKSYQKYLSKNQSEDSLLYLEALNEMRLLLAQQARLKHLVVVNIKNDIAFEFVHFPNVGSINIFASKSLLEDVFSRGIRAPLAELKRSYPVR